MTAEITLRRAAVGDASEVADMIGELLDEIMTATGVLAFQFEHAQAVQRLADFLGNDKYFVFVAHDGAFAVGFVAMYEGHAIYAGGAFGTITELYVRPAYRSAGVGSQLVARAKSFGSDRGWTRLEVTTPSLPEFERTLAFYEREGFSITGGRKLKVSLDV